jgi:hypothetical protein
VKRAFPIVVRSFLLLMAAACGDDESESKSGPVPKLTIAELLDPENCKDCHPKHYEEWSASMHAYATRDPVFIAMNKRMQEEAPENREFCVQCHAPMALREGAITDFADLSDVPPHLQGVTCYFCHNAVDVHEPFNAKIELANDATMRGALGNPFADQAAHGVLQKKSKWHDPTGIQSSQMCGSCHDIKAPSGQLIERTFDEYMMSVSSKPGPGAFNSCQDCHMKGKSKDEKAAEVSGVPTRQVHSHLFAAIDVALTPDLPHQDAMRAAVENGLQGCTLSDPTIDKGQSLAREPFEFIVTMEQIAGHSFPSGASADRRVWLEAAVYDDSDKLVFETQKIADGEVEAKPMDDPKHDPQFKPLRDYLFDADGNETHMFWEAATYKPDVMPYATDFTTPHFVTRTFITKQPLDKPPARIELWIRLRPIGVDVLRDLVDSGHLDPSVVERMPTLTVAHGEVRWEPAKNNYGDWVSLLPGAPECRNVRSLSEWTSEM